MKETFLFWSRCFFPTQTEKSGCCLITVNMICGTSSSITGERQHQSYYETYRWLYWLWLFNTFRDWLDHLCYAILRQILHIPSTWYFCKQMLFCQGCQSKQETSACAQGYGEEPLVPGIQASRHFFMRQVVQAYFYRSLMESTTSTPTGCYTGLPNTPPPN